MTRERLSLRAPVIAYLHRQSSATKQSHPLEQEIASAKKRLAMTGKGRLLGKLPNSSNPTIHYSARFDYHFLLFGTDMLESPKLLRRYNFSNKRNDIRHVLSPPLTGRPKSRRKKPSAMTREIPASAYGLKSLIPSNRLFLAAFSRQAFPQSTKIANVMVS